MYLHPASANIVEDVLDCLKSLRPMQARSHEIPLGHEQVDTFHAEAVLSEIMLANCHQGLIRAEDLSSVAACLEPSLAKYLT
jgi:hypothetical protein